MRSIFIGFDPRESGAYAVARESVRAHLSSSIPVRGIVLSDLRRGGIYTRPTEKRLGRLYDVQSRRDGYDGAMSTEFALSRFWILHLAQALRNERSEVRIPVLGRREPIVRARQPEPLGWSLFMDCDMLVRGDIADVFNFAEANPHWAAVCVKHVHLPDTTTKMDDQKQSAYPRKNWSSFFLLNEAHPSNQVLTLEYLNTVPGVDLHRFSWLQDDEIGELGPEWNYLVRYTQGVAQPLNIHFTAGIPLFAGFEHDEYADEWFSALAQWAR